MRFAIYSTNYRGDQMWLFAICLGNAFAFILIGNIKIQWSHTNKHTQFHRSKKRNLIVNGFAFALNMLVILLISFLTQPHPEQSSNNKKNNWHPNHSLVFISAFWLDNKYGMYAKMHKPMKNVTKITSISKSHHIFTQNILRGCIFTFSLQSQRLQRA